MKDLRGGDERVKWGNRGQSRVMHINTFPGKVGG